MSGLRAILVAVDYTDLLAVTLPINRHHFDEVWVVTSPADEGPVSAVCQQHNARVVVTDRFYRDGAVFNKWAALEYGLDQMGRRGWICLMDADVLWPHRIDERTRWGRDLNDPAGGMGEPGEAIIDCDGWHGLTRYALQPGYLYSPLRRMYNPMVFKEEGGLWIPPESEWAKLPIHPNVAEWAGYSQIFHAQDPILLQACARCGCSEAEHHDYHDEVSYCHGNCNTDCEGFVWHQVDWAHAGGADSMFQLRWPTDKKLRPPFEVLHLGPAGTNWCGRATPYLDGTVGPGAEQKRERVQAYLRGRRGKQGDARFEHERIRPASPFAED